MIKKAVVFSLFICCVLLLCQCHENKSGNYTDEIGRLNKLYPAEDYFLSKQFPDGIFDFKAYDRALSEVYSFVRKTYNRSSGEWQVEGPGNIGARANTIAVSPHDEKRMLLGFSEGGLWLTEDGGQNWIPVFDDNSYLSIGDVVFDPKNPNIAYVGTGDPNVSGFPFIGNGIHKSTDGGKTWKHMGLTETRIISQIRISEENNNIIYVSAMGIPFFKDNNRGVYKSTDGGNSWSQVLFVNDSTGVCDMAIHPENHDILYVSTWNRIRNNTKSIVSGPDAKVYKTENGGITWTDLNNGLPDNNSSRVGIDICRSNPNVLYAAYTDPTTFNVKGIFKTVDAGNTWIELPIGENVGLPENMYGGFGWYFGKIRISPLDEDDVFILGVDMYRSKNGGLNWELSVPEWYFYEVHADKHDLIFQGENMYLATDGGAYMSNIMNVEWKDIENIPTTQFYRVAYNPHEPTWYYGGAQDNGSTGGNAEMINSWPRIFGGDGFQMLFHSTNPDIFYVETQNGGIFVTESGGDDFSFATEGIESSDPRNWDMPIIMSSHNPDILYTGTNKIYKNSTGSAVLWEPISGVLTDSSSTFLRRVISSISESNIDPLFLAVGTTDGNIWLTKDGGTSWKEISTDLPQRYISAVSIWNDYVFVTMTGYKDADNTPYIYATNDEGENWISFQFDLPRIAINSLVILPEKENIIHPRLVVGTDGGVFYYKGGEKWIRLGNNMPIVPVYGLGYNPILNTVIAGTFGRSIMSFDMGQVIDTPVKTENIPTISTVIQIQKNLLTQSEILQINSNSTESIQVEIVSAQGIVMSRKLISNLSTSIPLMAWPSGLYFVRTTDKKYKGTLKFVVI